MSEILNFDAGRTVFEEKKGDGSGQGKVHIRIQQRTARKAITIIQGLDEDLDQKRICRAFRKNFSCNGAVVKDKDTKNEIIQLQGDQRENAKKFMVESDICTEDRIVVHGF